MGMFFITFSRVAHGMFFITFSRVDHGMVFITFSRADHGMVFITFSGTGHVMFFLPPQEIDGEMLMLCLQNRSNQLLSQCQWTDTSCMVSSYQLNHTFNTRSRFVLKWNQWCQGKDWKWTQYIWLLERMAGRYYFQTYMGFMIFLIFRTQHWHHCKVQDASLSHNLQEP